MKKYIPKIFMFILMLAIAVQCINQNGSNKSIRKIKAENELLNKQNDSLMDEKELLKLNYTKLTQKFDSLSGKVSDSKERLIIIEEKQNEKINNVDRYTIGDKQSYFTDRYK